MLSRDSGQSSANLAKQPPVRGSNGRSDGSSQTDESDAEGKRGAGAGAGEIPVSPSSSLPFLIIIMFSSVFCSVFLAFCAVWVVHQSVRSRTCCRKRKSRDSTTLLDPPVTPPAKDPMQDTLQQGMSASPSNTNSAFVASPSPTPPSPPQLPGQLPQSNRFFPSTSPQRPPQPRPVPFPGPDDPTYDEPYAFVYENWPFPDRPEHIHQPAFGHPKRILSETDQQETAMSCHWAEPRVLYLNAPPGTIAATDAGAAGDRTLSDSTEDTAMESVERNNDEDNEEDEDEEEDESHAYTRASGWPQPQQQQVLNAKQLAEIAAQNGESNPAYGLSPNVWQRRAGVSSLPRTLLPSAAGHCVLCVPSPQTDSVFNDSVVWLPRQDVRAALTMHMYCPIGGTLPVGAGRNHPLVRLPPESGPRLVSDIKQQQIDEAQDDISTKV